MECVQIILTLNSVTQIQLKSTFTCIWKYHLKHVYAKKNHADLCCLDRSNMCAVLL